MRSASMERSGVLLVSRARSVLGSTPIVLATAAIFKSGLAAARLSILGIGAGTTRPKRRASSIQSPMTASTSCNASCGVSPSAMQPGSSGTLANHAPSLSDHSRFILYFVLIMFSLCICRGYTFLCILSLAQFGKVSLSHPSWAAHSESPLLPGGLPHGATRPFA